MPDEPPAAEPVEECANESECADTSDEILEAMHCERVWARRVQAITNSVVEIRAAQAAYEVSPDDVDDRAFGATLRAGLAALRRLYRFGGDFNGSDEAPEGNE